jgi:protein TonB
MLSVFLHCLLIAAFLAIPPATPIDRQQNLAEVEILPVPPAPEPLVTPSEPEARTELPSEPQEAQNQPMSSEPAMVGEAEPAPQAEALPGEAGMPSSVGLRSGKGTGIPRVTGIPPVRAGKAGSGGGGFVAATAVYAPKPTYPPAAKKDGWEGAVVLQIRINTDGSVTVLSVLEGDRDDAKDAAVQVVSTWQYSPDRNESGIPVSSVRNVKVNFDLKDTV